MLLLGAAGALIGAPARSADAAAHAFVAAIYDTYMGKEGNGIALDDDKALRRYFEPSLATLIGKDQKDAARRNEVPTLDGDPFVDAQDWDITNLEIDVADAAPGKAQATVKFQNRDKPTTIVLDLVKIKNDWRIADITWQRDGKAETLRGLYAH
jgi:hypothetical protein